MRGCDYPAIVPDDRRGHDAAEGCVRGTFVEGLTDGDMWRLDVFEGGEYVRRKVVCKILGVEGEGEEEEVEAETYIWREEEDGLESGEWDFEEFRREKMGRWVGGTEEFEGESIWG